MRTGVSLSITPADLDRLQALVKDRNAPQKHVWRAQIVLLSAEGTGTNAIMRETGKAKTRVWRWQERFAADGFEGLLRDKTRPSRIPKLDPDIAERVVTLTMEAPPGETTHWDGRGDVRGRGRQRQFGSTHLALSWVTASSHSPVQAPQGSRVRRQVARRGWPLRRSAGARRGPVRR
jgi:hypothetical protein